MKKQMLEKMPPDEKIQFYQSRKNLVLPILYYLGFAGGASAVTCLFAPKTYSNEYKVVLSICYFLIAGIGFVPRICKNAKVHIQLINALKQKYK